MEPGRRARLGVRLGGASGKSDLMGLRCRVVFMVLFSAASCASRGASAHAIIVESVPAAAAVIKGSDLPVSLRFNSRVDQQRSQLTLTGPDGQNQRLTMSAAGAPDTIAARASGLQPGAYTLKWQVLAVDGHITSGNIPFRIAP
jgi:methionine-rich copper-binding protein CopC